VPQGVETGVFSFAQSTSGQRVTAGGASYRLLSDIFDADRDAALIGFSA
jgi:hypothetical protein